MESGSDAGPEESSMDEPSVGEAISDGAMLLPNAEVPGIVGSPEVFYPHEHVDRNVVGQMENLQSNMVIDLSRIAGGVFSPIIILNNLNNQPDAFGVSDDTASSNAFADEPVMNHQELAPVSPQSTSGVPAEGSDPVDHSEARSTRSTDRSTPGSTLGRKKRKRTITPKKKSTPPAPVHDDDDEGLLCSICFSEWTMTGDHRVVSLKCGHLFGMSCIKRWLEDNPAHSRCCATCKAKAKVADIRFIYGRAIKAIDNTRETELENELAVVKTKAGELRLKLTVTSQELNDARKELDRLRMKVDRIHQPGLLLESQEQGRRYTYTLTLEKNIVVNQEGGCRTMVWANNHKLLLISQKSNQPLLFPGYAIRLLQLPEVSGRSTSAVIHVGPKSVRDIALDVTDNLFTCATMDKSAKFYSLITRTVQFSITPDEDSVIWACAFDRNRPYIVYLGSQRGMVYVYDIRETNRFQYVYPVGHLWGDQTAVIKICPVTATEHLPTGGFLVCKLKSVWFFEYSASDGVENARGSALNIKGTFSSMTYNPDSGIVLIGLRPTPSAPSSLVLGTLQKEADTVTLNTLHKFEGSRIQAVLQRCAQLFLNNADTLVTAYREDTKTLSTWCTNGGASWTQQLPLAETVLDICPLFGSPGMTYVAALTDCRCRIYNIIAK